MAFRHTPYHMLVEALAQRGCPICAIVHEETLQYLDMLIHEHVNDLDFRADLRQAGGFCNTHGWWLHSRVHGAALGATIMYRDVVHTMRERLKHVIASGGTVLTRRAVAVGLAHSASAGRRRSIRTPAARPARCALAARPRS